MVPTLIILFLLALGVGIVAGAVRRRPARPYEQRLEQDTAWNDPMPSDDAPTDDAARAADPFAHAPPPPSVAPGEAPR